MIEISDGRIRGDVLVVDDTPENLAVITALLKDRGHRVRVAPSGALALAAVEAELPDLVLLDVSMPRMDGYEVCRRLKAHRDAAAIPVIFLSALAETDDKVKAFAAGGVDYVTKPFRAEEISARVSAHLALRQLRLQLEASNAELRRSNDRLRELERVRQELVGMIVHDLNNPISAVGATAQYLRDEAGLQGDHREAIEDVCRLTHVMGRMVVDILDVARTDDAKLRPRLAPVDPGQLVDDVVRDVRSLLRRDSTRIATRIDEGMPSISADPELLRRLVQNLLDNALKYAPSGTDVVVEVTLCQPDCWELRVSDAGPGIPVEDRERIFQPYARLDRDPEQQARSSRGLGLAFCRMATEAHDGRIWVESSPTGGSVFVVRLPVAPVPRAM